MTKVPTGVSIADASWKAVNLGAWQKEFQLQLDTPYGSLASEGSGDFLLEVKETATYRFEVFAGNREKPLVVYEEIER